MSHRGRGVAQGDGEGWDLWRDKYIAHLVGFHPHLHRCHGEREAQYAHGAGTAQRPLAEASWVGIAHGHVQFLGQLQIQMRSLGNDVLGVARAQRCLDYKEVALLFAGCPDQAQRHLCHDPLVAPSIPPRHLYGAVKEDAVAVVQSQSERHHGRLCCIGVGKAQEVQSRIILPGDMHHWAFGISVIGRLVVRIESHRIPFHVGPARQAHVQVVPALPVADVKGNAPDLDARVRFGQFPLGDPVPVSHVRADEPAVVVRAQIHRYKSTVYFCCCPLSVVGADFSCTADREHGHCDTDQMPFLLHRISLQRHRSPADATNSIRYCGWRSISRAAWAKKGYTLHSTQAKRSGLPSPLRSPAQALGPWMVQAMGVP